MRTTLKKHLLLAAGWLFVFLGFIGLFLPVMPTTPFLLVAAACFSKGSPRLHHWLLHLKHVGPALRRWEEDRVISVRAKTLATLCIVGGMSFPVVFVNISWNIKGILITIGVAVIVFLWLQKSEASPSSGNQLSDG